MKVEWIQANTGKYKTHRHGQLAACYSYYSYYSYHSYHSYYSYYSYYSYHSYHSCYSYYSYYSYHSCYTALTGWPALPAVVSTRLRSKVALWESAVRASQPICMTYDMVIGGLVWHDDGDKVGRGIGFDRFDGF